MQVYRPQRILVVKPDHLGDLLLATPALRQLRQALPNATLVGLVGPWSRQMWQTNPDLNQLLELPFPGFERASKGRNRLRPYLLLGKYAALLRQGRYDAALLLRDDHWWGAGLVALAGIPQRIGHAHPRSVPFLTTALPYDPRTHVTRQALEVVQALVQPGASSDLAPGLPALHFTPTADAQHWASDWRAAHLHPDERMVIIHPGTGGTVKHWSVAAWAQVANDLARLPGVRLICTGGPGEAPLVTELAALVEPAPLTLAGATSLGQLAALLGRAALVLGVDSGPLHLAVSQGVPTMHLFGPSDHQRFGPWGDSERQRVLRADLFCSPCGVFDTCPRGTRGPECMAAIAPEQVIAVAQRLLK
ncbi:glycosyltransferase family 9 protein [Candidatus Chloroploca sp. Khr17]|uniref:glycosyltransferase family 9 protein n=1 Tax=Candidatus Chloroploca sp. Khr17 TaxID=2496869 RepID=UPI00101D5351|nr:glycosyltransferase family 9 protein [Candidatus Chloroploca sp. Khr17]